MASTEEFQISTEAHTTIEKSTKTEEFITAVKSNDASKVSEFLSENPSLIDAKSGDNSAILTAIYYGAKDVTHVLLENGVKLSYFEAVAAGCFEVVLNLLTNDPALLNCYSHDGFTALGLAAFFGHRDLVAELLARGADVHAISHNPMKVLALHSSVAHQHVEISEILIQHGADINAKQQEGFTPLLEAVQNGQLNMVQMLIKHRADVNLAKDDGVSPLALARQLGRVEVTDLLVENGAIQ